MRPRAGEVELWDHKATRASTRHVDDYARHLLTYATPYRDRSGRLPARCVLFFVIERDANRRLLAIDVSAELVDAALDWTKAHSLQHTTAAFEDDPSAVGGGEPSLAELPPAQRVTDELWRRCTTCGHRFDCNAYIDHLGGPAHPYVDIQNV